MGMFSRGWRRNLRNRGLSEHVRSPRVADRNRSFQSKWLILTEEEFLLSVRNPLFLGIRQFRFLSEVSWETVTFCVYLSIFISFLIPKLFSSLNLLPLYIFCSKNLHFFMYVYHIFFFFAISYCKTTCTFLSYCILFLYILSLPIFLSFSPNNPFFISFPHLFSPSSQSFVSTLLIIFPTTLNCCISYLPLYLLRGILTM